MAAADSMSIGKQLVAKIMRDVETGTGAYAGAMVTREQIEPGLLRNMRATVDEARAAVGLPRMFQGLLDEVRSTRVAGATPEQTLELIVDKLRTTTTRWQIREEIPPLRQIIGDLHVPSAMEPLRNETLEQLQRNLDRLEGRLHDGFHTYPDYGELGKALANSELLLDVHRVGGPGAPQGIRGAAKAADDALVW